MRNKTNKTFFLFLGRGLGKKPGSHPGWPSTNKNTNTTKIFKQTG